MFSSGLLLKVSIHKDIAFGLFRRHKDFFYCQYYFIVFLI